MSNSTEINKVIFNDIVTSIPKSISDIQCELMSLGYQKSYRQLSRILNDNAPIYGANCRISSGKKMWFYDSHNYATVNQAGMSSSEAAVYLLFKEHLSSLVPNKVLKDLRDNFEAANEVFHRLNKSNPNNSILNWLGKISLNTEVTSEIKSLDEVKKNLYSENVIKFEYNHAENQRPELCIVNPEKLEKQNGKVILLGQPHPSYFNENSFDVDKITNIEEAKFSESGFARRSA